MSERSRTPIASTVLLAAFSALAFGVTTPLVARFGKGLGVLTPAALLYLGAAAVSVALRPFSKRSGRRLGRDALPRLAAIALFGASLAPALLVLGLGRSGPAAASLVLNFEALFTFTFAWLLYREAVGARVVTALVVMTLGGLFVAADGLRNGGTATAVGLLAVLGATASWALDNVLSRALSDRDPLDVVAAKSALGAAVTGALALAFAEPAPRSWQTAGLLLCGATGYGLSLRLYLLAQRGMGAARTASVFATGPFLGAVFAWAMGDRSSGWGTLLGAIAFGFGAYLHLSEHHSHRHFHAAIEHEHAHRHDDGHHTHAHDPPVVGEHTHRHRHEALEHEHEHAPDVHHDHTHS